MQIRTIGLAALLALTVSARADKDAFAGWTPQQLKTKILQLQKENNELKDKIAMAPTAAAVPAAGAAATAPAAVAGDKLIDDFEADQAKNGQTWWAGCDDNKLGTTLAPMPWAPEKGGSPASPGRSGRIHGKMGANHEPWPWASLAIPMDVPDLRGYSAVSFYVKGDGAKHLIHLCKTSVKDFADHQAFFQTTKDWTKVTVKFSELAQPSWGAVVPGVYNDVEKIQFTPGAPEASYDFSIDDLTLVK